MTFTELKTKVKDYVNLTSTDADTRIGKSINAVYRRITSSLGMDATRFVTRSASMGIGVQTVTFTGIEKIDRILDVTDANAIRLLQEVGIHEIRSMQPSDTLPSQWALENTLATSVTALFDTVPQTAYSLQADGWTNLSDLSGTDTPAFPESFHDILVFHVIAEELLKKEKPKLAEEYERRAERLLSDLRFHLADSHTRDTPQGGGMASASMAGSGGSGGTVGGTNYTQTGLITFDRDPSAPFAVTSGSAVVANLDADKLDGIDSTAFAQKAVAETIAAAWLFTGIGNTGLRVLDTDASHALSIVPGSNLTAARTLTITTGDASRTITLSGNPTLADWFDQAVKAASTPTFAGAAFGANSLSGALSFAGIANTGLKVLDTDASHVLSIVPGSNLTANRILTITTGDAARTVTLNGNPTLDDWFDQSVKVAATPTFGATTITGALTISGAAAGQIVFPGTQNASAGANTLDDYEEGTWTPADGSGATLSFTVNSAQYVKIGQLVIASCDIAYPATGNGASAIISGLPFTNQSINAWGGFCHASVTGGVTARVVSGGTTIALLDITGTAKTNAQLTGALVRLVVFFRASA